MRVLIIIPAYNEEEGILSTVKSVTDLGYDYVVINDGSIDSTLSLCMQNKINVINLPINLGIGGAVQTGHKYAYENGYDVDIQFDGDGQHNASYINILVEEIENGADLVVGSRFIRGKKSKFQSTIMRRVGIKWISGLIYLFTSKEVTDPTSGFRASGKKALLLFSRKYSSDYPEPESIVSAINAGLVVKEVPVEMNERKTGQSSISPIKSIYYMIKVTLAIFIQGIRRK